jgi:molecular chaperone GrpE
MAKKTVKPVEEKKVNLELENVKGMLARALADYDNLSKRIERERQDLGKIASVGVIIKLLPVLDNLEAAQIHLKDQGLAISIGEFKKVLSEEGLTEIKPQKGDEFNENEMEAIEVVKGVRDNMVSETVLTGWKYIDGTMVRHAKVKVSKIELN